LEVQRGSSQRFRFLVIDWEMPPQGHRGPVELLAVQAGLQAFAVG
jgi:hypothetical protein